MKDMWAAAPGTDRATLRAQRRSKLKAALAATLVMTLGIGGLVYASMRASTAVSTQDALAEFRSDASGSREKERARKGATETATRRDKKRTNGRSAPARAASNDNGDQAVAAGSESENTTGVARSENAPAAAPNEAAPTRPADGVYAWAIEGYEQAPGVRRNLPRESHRIITYEGAGWQEHHIFSEQKEQWFDLQLSREGVSTTAVRNRVVMGPVTVDRTVTYDPPCFVSRFPVKVGQTWKGSWSGKTSGTYVAETFERTTLTIGGEEVEVYGTEVIMDLKGEVEGRVVTRSWVAPDYALVVKQYQESEVRSGPGDYYSEWSGQLTSLTPQR